MYTSPNNPTDSLAAQFWADVRARLIGHYNRKAPQGDEGVGRLRYESERLGFSGAVYNQGVERTAEVIDGCLDRGWPELSPPR